MSEILGLDVGGTNIKGAIVDTITGQLLTERIKYKTPRPADADHFVEIIQNIKSDLAYTGDKAGIGFPSVIRNGICCSAANIDKSWIGKDVDQYFQDILGVNAKVINDADAAGLAELHFGKLKGINGPSLLLTIGTGIGSALFIDGVLYPNTELGHVDFRGKAAEKFISNKIRKEEDLSMEEFGKKVNELLKYFDDVFSPGVILLGGGVSKSFDKFKDQIDPELKVDAAELYNHAGIIGAALAI